MTCFFKPLLKTTSLKRYQSLIEIFTLMKLTKIIAAIASGQIKGHFGQYGEDILIRKIFDFANIKGRYVDLGAYHPFRFSNTAYLWMRGWQGINVDANPNTVTLFKKIRKSDTNIWGAVVTQHEFDTGQKNVGLMLPAKPDRYGLSAIGTINTHQANQNGMMTQVEVPTTTLKNILQSHNITHVDFLNIDIEGYDEKIILDFDFTICKPKSIAVEIFSKSVCETVQTKAVAHLKKNGYTFYAVAGYTAIFVLIE